MNLSRWEMVHAARVCSCSFSDMVSHGRTIWEGGREVTQPFLGPSCPARSPTAGKTRGLRSTLNLAMQGRLGLSVSGPPTRVCRGSAA